MEKLKKDDYIYGGLQNDFYGENEREYCSYHLCGIEKYFQLDTERGAICC